MNWKDRVVELPVLEHHGREVGRDLGHPQAVRVVVAARRSQLEKIKIEQKYWNG